MRRDHPNELRADLQRVYGVCLDDVGRGVSVRHAAALAACLPEGSLVLAKEDPRRGFTDAEWLLLGILNAVRTFGGAEPLDPFGERAHRVSLDAESYMERLSRPRKAVGDGDGAR